MFHIYQIDTLPRTVIAEYFSHRLSALRNADIIATVCDGKITKVGTYSEMIKDATLQKEVLAEEVSNSQQSYNMIHIEVNTVIHAVHVQRPMQVHQGSS